MSIISAIGAWRVAGLLAAAFSIIAAAATAAMAADRLTLTLPVKTVSFAPIFLAIDAGHFARRDIDMKVVVVRGGSPAIASLLAGDAQFISVADDELLKVAESDRIIRVHCFSNAFTQNLQVRGEILEARKITAELPVYERVRRLKGITFGVIAPGGSSDLAGRWLFRQAGLDPQADMKILRIGDMPALIAALKTGQIDAFVLSAPAGPIVEHQGIGKIAVRYDEIPQFADEPFLGIDTRRDYVAANRDLVRRVVEAVATAQSEIFHDPGAAAAKLKQDSFAQIDLPILEKSLVLMRSAYRAEKMTKERWDFVRAMRVALGNRDLADIEVKEGVHWTNDFFPR
jgi:ABC-type nitrate/sulfonate/bicarbonate transport system substrate-binding protein